MKLLFENWRNYINKMLLLEGSAENLRIAKKNIIRDLENWPIIVQIFQSNIEEMSGVGGNQHLPHLAKLLNNRIMTEIFDQPAWKSLQAYAKAPPLPGTETSIERLQKNITNRYQRVFQHAKELLPEYHKYTERGITFKESDQAQVPGARSIEPGPIKPISKWPYLNMWFEVVKKARYIVALKDYKKDPEVISKAKATTKIVHAGAHHSIYHPTTTEGSCIFGCSPWCISQVPDPDPEEEKLNPKNWFMNLTEEGKLIYIVTFKHLQRTPNKYKSVALIYRKGQGGPPESVWDCGGNESDRERRENGLEMAVKFNLLSYAAAKIGRVSPGKGARQLLKRFELWLEQYGGKGAFTDELTTTFRQIALELGIDLERSEFSSKPWRPLPQWYHIVGEQRDAILNLSSTHITKIHPLDEYQAVVNMLFDDEKYPFYGIWKTIGPMDSDYFASPDPGIAGLRAGETYTLRYLVGAHLKQYRHHFKKVQERLQVPQESGEVNVDAARSLVWKYIQKGGTVSRGASDKIIEKHWEWDKFEEDPVEWLKKHEWDIKEEIFKVMLTPRLSGPEWLKDESNRKWLASEIRRFMDQSREQTMELIQAIISRNPTLVAEKTWKLVYGTARRELGHKIEAFLGGSEGDRRRAWELARQADEEREELAAEQAEARGLPPGAPIATPGEEARPAEQPVPSLPPGAPEVETGTEEVPAPAEQPAPAETTAFSRSPKRRRIRIGRGVPRRGRVARRLSENKSNIKILIKSKRKL